MIAPAGPRFVAYYRVSTDKQGRSGLGLDAQRAAVARHAASAGGVVAAAFEEVESGRRGDRPQLGLALAECRLRRAVLLIAKLDRLARDAHFLLGLEKAGVEFLAADMPHANRLTVGIMALVAEEEARATSARTKAALAAAKARGVRLGNPRLKPGDSATGSRRTRGLVGADSSSRSRGAAISQRSTAGWRLHTPAARRRAHCPWCARSTRRRAVAALAGTARARLHSGLEQHASGVTIGKLWRLAFLGVVALESRHGWRHAEVSRHPRQPADHTADYRLLPALRRIGRLH